MLNIIQVGHAPANVAYINRIRKNVEAAGMEVDVLTLTGDSTTGDVLDAIYYTDCKLKNKAIMVAMPLPAQINSAAVKAEIPTDKDIDGLNPKSDYLPLTPSGIMRYLHENGIHLEGKKVTILGRSEVVGLPLAEMMIRAGATVTSCNSKTEYPWIYTSGSDIVVSAMGKPNLINIAWTSGVIPQIWIDVGINVNVDGICGDIPDEVRAEIVSHKGWCSPVPGGVGKWTQRELILRLKEMEGIE